MDFEVLLFAGFFGQVRFGLAVLEPNLASVTLDYRTVLPCSSSRGSWVEWGARSSHSRLPLPFLFVALLYAVLWVSLNSRIALATVTWKKRSRSLTDRQTDRAYAMPLVGVG